MTIKTIADVEKALQPYIDRAGQAIGKDITLDRTKELARLVGNPHERLKAVHIAGTSGKTSTSYYIAAMLRSSGLKVGLTVSPHIDSITERVQIDGAPLDEKLFCNYFEEFLAIVETSDVPMATYFELMIVFATWVFAKEKVDYAVLETGLGGLHDTTNIVDRSDKLCVITDIGLDHMEILGDTLEEITRQKVGITHKDNWLVMYEQSETVMRVVREQLGRTEGTLIIAPDELGVSISDDMPLFQKRNWRLAYTVVQTLSERDHINLDIKNLEATQDLHVPGRMDIVKVDATTIVLDGAHNQQKMSTFIQSFEQLFPGVSPVVLYAQKQRKDVQATVPLLANLASRFIATRFSRTQDVPLNAIEPNEIKNIFTEKSSKPCDTAEDPLEAIKQLIDEQTPFVVVTGSFFLVGEIRRLIRS